MKANNLRYHVELMPLAENHQPAWKWPVILFLMVAAFYWKVTLTRQYSWVQSPDLVYQVVPWLQYQAGEWHRGAIPLWDPYEWAGQPLVGQGLPGAVYPPNWLLFMMPLRHGWIRQAVLEWYYVLIHYMGALFCFWFCRDLGRSHAASLLAGLGFALGGWMGNTDWPQMLNGAVWAPLVFMFLLRAVRGVRPIASAALSGAFLGVSFLSGHHQIPIFIGLACAGVWGWHLLPKVRVNPRAGLPLVVFGLFLLLVSALQTFPAYEYGNLALRWVGAENPVGWKTPVPYSVHMEFGLGALSILGILIPGILQHSDPFLGVVLVSLAISAVVAAWGELTVRILSLVALIALFYSLAADGFIEGLIYSLVPMVEKARNPSMAIFMFHFGTCILFAYGIDTYELIDIPWRRRLPAALAIFGGLVFAVLLACSLAGVSWKIGPDRPAMVALIALMMACVLFAWGRARLARNPALAAIGFLMLAEVGLCNSAFSWHPVSEPNHLLKKLSEHADIAGYLQRQTLPVRVQFDKQEVPYNFGDWYGVDTIDGFLASMTANVQEAQGNPASRALMGTNFYVGRKPLDAAQSSLFEGRSGLKVYRIPGAFPRSWTVHELISMKNQAELGQRLSVPLPQLRRQAFLSGPLPALVQCGSADQTRVVSRTSNRMLIEAVMGCRGMVVSGEVYFPGWQATVDGAPAHLYEVYGFVRGIVVEGGRHRIEMRYRPASVVWGAICTGLGLLALAFLAWRR